MDSVFSIAVHGLVYLNHKGGTVNSEELAANICTNPARVRKVMAELKKAGMVETREGHVGGYRFCADADTLSLAQVAEALGTHFVTSAWRSGDCDMECLIASGMADLMDELYSELDRQCYKNLEEIKLADVTRKLFEL